MRRFFKLLTCDFFNFLKLLLYLSKFMYYRFKGIKTVVYNLHHNYFFDIFESVYQLLLENSQVKVFFSYSYNDEMLKDYLLQKCDEKALINNLISPFIPFDLFICPEITGPDFPISYLKTKTVQIYHGTGTYNLYEKVNVLNRFDIHFAVGPQYIKFIEYAYKNVKKIPIIYDIGYPKLDKLLQKDPLTEKLKQLYRLDEKTTIIYAPHWNEFSSIHKFGKELLEKLAALNVNILIKPHNYLFTKYAEDNWKLQFENLAKKFKNIRIVDRPNTQELYPLADLMITDTGTTAALEFSLLRKPLFIFCNQEWFRDKQHAEVEDELCKTSICFSKTDQLKNTIISYLSGELEQEFKTQQIKQKRLVENFLFNIGNASELSYKTILKELDMDIQMNQ